MKLLSHTNAKSSDQNNLTAGQKVLASRILQLVDRKFLAAHSQRSRVLCRDSLSVSDRKRFSMSRLMNILNIGLIWFASVYFGAHILIYIMK